MKENECGGENERGKRKTKQEVDKKKQIKKCT